MVNGYRTSIDSGDLMASLRHWAPRRRARRTGSEGLGWRPGEGRGRMMILMLFNYNYHHFSNKTLLSSSPDLSGDTNPSTNSSVIAGGPQT